MIRYNSEGFQMLFNLVKTEGSVFPKAIMISIPNALVSGLFVLFIYDVDAAAHFNKEQENIITNNAMWGGFSALVGFLVVFRTSQAYDRFCDGVAQTFKMGAMWFDACSSLIAFCKYSTAPEDQVLSFQNLLIRLASMLHATALGEMEAIEGDDINGYTRVHAFSMPLIDAGSINRECLQQVRDSEARVELIFQWIQQLIVHNIKNGVLSIPPPILSRSFQEIALGMVHFNEAMKISTVLFPFPYAQTCDMLLLLHWLVVPFVVSQWVTRPWWAFCFAFIQVFALWTLNLISMELENPFGSDPNDLDAELLQNEFNSHLCLLLRKESQLMPYLVNRIQDLEEFTAATSRCERDESMCTSFTRIWQEMGDAKIAKRISITTSKKISRDVRCSSPRSIRGQHCGDPLQSLTASDVFHSTSIASQLTASHSVGYNRSTTTDMIGIRSEQRQCDDPISQATTQLSQVSQATSDMELARKEQAEVVEPTHRGSNILPDNLQGVWERFDVVPEEQGEEHVRLKSVQGASTQLDSTRSAVENGSTPSPSISADESAKCLDRNRGPSMPSSPKSVSPISPRFANFQNDYPSLRKSGMISF